MSRSGALILNILNPTNQYVSEQLTAKDFEELQLKANKILQDLESVDKTEWKKKKELIDEYVITSRILLKADKLPIQNNKDFCSYIVLQLNNRGITVNQNGVFYSLFTDDEKGNQGPSNRLQVDNISSAFETAQERVRQTKEVIVDGYTDYLEYTSVSLQQCKELVDDILRKYPEFQEEIKEGLGKVDQLMQEEKEIRAELEHIAGNLDLRNKARDFKKIKALLLEKIEYNIAKVAQLIHITPKHMSANIMKGEQTELLEKTKWFDVIDVKCSCGKENTLDIADWFNKQVERMGLSLPFKKPKITHLIES